MEKENNQLITDSLLNKFDKKYEPITCSKENFKKAMTIFNKVGKYFLPVIFPVVGNIISNIVNDVEIENTYKEFLEKILLLDSKIDEKTKQTSTYERILKEYGRNIFFEKIEHNQMEEILNYLIETNDFNTFEKNQIIEFIASVTNEEWNMIISNLKKNYLEELVNMLGFLKQEINSVIRFNIKTHKFVFKDYEFSEITPYSNESSKSIYSANDNEKINQHFLETNLSSEKRELKVISVLGENKKHFFRYDSYPEKWQFLLKNNLVEISSDTLFDNRLDVNRHIKPNSKLYFLLKYFYFRDRNELTYDLLKEKGYIE